MYLVRKEISRVYQINSWIGYNTWVGAERANVRSPESAQVGTAAIGDIAAAPRRTMKITRVG